MEVRQLCQISSLVKYRQTKTTYQIHRHTGMYFLVKINNYDFKFSYLKYHYPDSTLSFKHFCLKLKKYASVVEVVSTFTFVFN